MKTTIPVKITLEADHLEKIPSHKLLAIAEGVLNQLQTAYAAELWSDDGPEKIFEDQKTPGEFSLIKEFHLEYHQPKGFEDDEIRQAQYSESLNDDNPHQ